MAHQSPSPLCEVDKSQRELGTGQDQKLRWAGVGRRELGYETTNDQRTQLRNDWREKTLQYVIQLAIYTAKRQLLSQMRCIGVIILYKLSEIESA